MDEAPPGELHLGENLGKTIVRLFLLGGLGIGSGWLSFQAVAYAPVGEVHEELRRFSPGLIYGLLWLGVAWWPGLLVVRDRQRRSLLWVLAFLVGMAVSYVAAYEVTRLFFVRASPHLLPGMRGGSEIPFLIPSGLVGGFAGGLCLAFALGFLFRAFDSWAARLILCFAGAFLGTSIGLWFPMNDEGGDPHLMAFFQIWQGGMAVSIGAIDGWWRRSDPGNLAGS